MEEMVGLAYSSVLQFIVSGKSMQDLSNHITFTAESREHINTQMFVGLLHCYTVLGPA